MNDAPDEYGLVGVWKLLSHQLIVEDGDPILFYGSNPKSFLVLTPEGRMIGILTSDNRKPGLTDAERAELHKSMIAYSGRYRVAGNQFVTTVDVSWNESTAGKPSHSRQDELRQAHLCARRLAPQLGCCGHS
jgi:hypothetical protein